MKDNNKIMNIALSLCLCFWGISCTLQDGPAQGENKKLTFVEFEVNTNLSDKVSHNRITEPHYLDALILQKKDNGSYVVESNVDDVWTKGAENQYSLIKPLEVGVYHFAITKGMARVADLKEGNNGNSCYITGKDFENLTDLKIIHPHSNDLLKDCMPLFLEKDNGQFPVQMDLSTISSKVQISRKLEYAHSRIDLLIVRADKNSDGTYTPVNEDPFGTKIANIELKLSNVNNVCRLSDNSFDIQPEYPTKFEKNLLKENFVKFNYNTYIQNIDANQIQNNEFLKSLPESAWINDFTTKGIYFYPSEGVDIILTINYKAETGITSYEETLNNVDLFRNKIRLIVIRVLNDKFSVDPNVGIADEMPKIEVDLIGEGFWN